MNATNPQPNLDAPGAGLPKLELHAARLMFRRFRKKHNIDSLSELIHSEKQEMIKLSAPLDARQGAARILIKRLRGLEDSSRFWSVYMTLEHVRIVNSAVIATMTCLATGKTPERKASTADVKPSEDIGREVLDAFAASCDGLIATVDEIENLDRPETWSHPWFGPLTIRDWHAMAAFHLGLHRVQIEAILKGMPAGDG